MGIDVNLYAVGKVTAAGLEAAEVFISERCDDRDGCYETWLRRSAYGPDRIEFQTLHRYYGPGYERGPWPVIHNYIVTLRAALPGCTVHYGGDSDWGNSPEATDDYLAEIWQHYLGPDGFAYFRAGMAATR